LSTPRCAPSRPSAYSATMKNSDNRRRRKRAMAWGRLLLTPANAFDVFRAGLHQFEIVRLCALWDRAGDDKENIPTIIELIDLPDGFPTIVVRHFEVHQDHVRELARG